MKNDEGKFEGPNRVWKEGCEYPGLALSRSLGDTVGKEVGVCATPEITKIPFKPDEHHFLILITDGIADVMSNLEIVNFVQKYRT
jgi:serine/threonine protein phosphatase PrpC